jgi:hypothetical protein
MAEFLLLAAGGATSAPSPDTSYATPIVFHLVRASLLFWNASFSICLILVDLDRGTRWHVARL